MHPLRERCTHLGARVQIDGSPLAWLEDRTEAESTFSYCEAAEHYFQRQGKPLALDSDQVGRSLTVQETCVLCKNLTVQHPNGIYPIQTKRPTYALQHATVGVCERRNREITIEYKGKPLSYMVNRTASHQAQVGSSKQLDRKLDGLTVLEVCEEAQAIHSTAHSSLATLSHSP